MTPADGDPRADAKPGGCSCGAIRFVVTGTPEQVLVCHCPDCRRAAGAQSVAWLLLPKAAFRVLQGTPAPYHSSGGVTRTFCSSCGTTISWEREDYPDRIDVTLGRLDDPEAFVPTKAVYRRHRLSWASPI